MPDKKQPEKKNNANGLEFLEVNLKKYLLELNEETKKLYKNIHKTKVKW